MSLERHDNCGADGFTKPEGNLGLSGRARGGRPTGVEERGMSAHGFPRNLGDLIERFDKILVPEMNSGQLTLLLNARFQRGAVALPKVQGLPFKISEISDKIAETLG